jgi:hypothetical protein
MNFQLQLNIDNGEEEISYLNDFIKEHDIQGLETEIAEVQPENGTMDGVVLVNALNLLVTGTIGAVITQVFSAIGKYFEGKKAEVVLKYKCPDNGFEFTEKYIFTSSKKREEIYEEFRKTIEKNCKKGIVLLKP